MMTGRNPNSVDLICDGFVACHGDKIVDVGLMKNLKEALVSKKTKIIDAKGKVIMPGIIDCHTHLIFAGSREKEFKMRLEGKSYLEILAAGGGILSTVKATRKASKKELLKKALSRLNEMLRYGITTVEIKSGYGLDLKSELKILDVAKSASRKHVSRIVPTFLGAHAVPLEYKGRSDEYLDFLIKKVLPKVVGKADFVDIFCENGAFSLSQSERYLKAVKKMGFKLKIHADQLNSLGGCGLAAKLKAVSCDHCDHISRADIKKLAESGTIAVLLPIAALYAGDNTFVDGRKMIKSGVFVAVSTDFNPGSAPTNNIFLAMGLACSKFQLTVEEVLNAVTINAARALDLSDKIGSLEKGKIADVVLMNVSDYSEIPYWTGKNFVEKVVVGGKLKSF